MTVAQPASIFATVGPMARPAGVAGMMASDPKTAPSAVYSGQQLTKSLLGTKHALQVVPPYAETAASPFWPREPDVHPNQKYVGAGCVSGGSIDNTYLPAPLRNMWGKAREMAKREVVVPPHKQCTDLLVVSKNCKMPPPPQTVADMKVVRPQYTKSIPLLHQMDPQRFDSGFTREPNIIPGAKPPPMFHVPANLPTVPDDWRLRKLKCAPHLSAAASPCPAEPTRRCGASALSLRPRMRPVETRRVAAAHPTIRRPLRSSGPNGPSERPLAHATRTLCTLAGHTRSRRACGARATHHRAPPRGRYDQTATPARIDVSRVVRSGQPLRRPGSAPPKFQTMPAGLPGGLSLVACD